MKSYLSIFILIIIFIHNTTFCPPIVITQTSDGKDVVIPAHLVHHTHQQQQLITEDEAGPASPIEIKLPLSTPSADIHQMIQHLKTIDDNTPNLLALCQAEDIDTNISQLLLADFLAIEQLSACEIQALAQKIMSPMTLMQLKENPDFCHRFNRLSQDQKDRVIQLIKYKTYQRIFTLDRHRNSITSIACSPDQRTIATTSDDHTICMWNRQTGKLLHRLTAHEKNVIHGTFSPDGTTLLTTSEDHTARLFNIISGQQRMVFRGHTDWVNHAAFHPRQPRIATASFDHTVRLWDIPTGKCLHELAGHTNRVHSVTFSPDGSLLASASWDNTIHICDLEHIPHHHILKGHTDWIKSVVFSHDGKYVLSASWDNTARLWDTITGQCICIFEHRTGQYNWAWPAQFSYDGDRIVVPYANGFVCIYHRETGKLLHRLQHTDRVNSAFFNPEGTLILTGSTDGTSRIWDSHTGTMLQVLQGSNAKFTPDGNHIVTKQKNHAYIWIPITDLTSTNHRLPQVAFILLLNRLIEDRQELILDNEDHPENTHLFVLFNSFPDEIQEILVNNFPIITEKYSTTYWFKKKIKRYPYHTAAIASSIAIGALAIGITMRY